MEKAREPAIAAGTGGVRDMKMRRNSAGRAVRLHRQRAVIKRRHDERITQHLLGIGCGGGSRTRR